MPTTRKNNDEDVIIIRARPEKEMKTITALVYALQACSFLLGFTYIAAIIINYVKRKDVMGTWLESHFLWQMRTFWYSLLWIIISSITTPILIGFLGFAIVAVWVIYRIVKGWMYLSENRAMYL